MGLNTEGNETSMPSGFKITAAAVQGGRRHMEDRVHIEAVRDMYGKLDHLFAAVYDGHGGAQASEYVCKNLHNNIKNNKSFYSDDDREVLCSIRDSFIKTHYAMQKMVEHWPMTTSGFPCAAGTTASVAIIRGTKVYTGHVGDSAIVVTSNFGKQNNETLFTARKLTEDHKPDSEMERRRIESVGGKVARRAGVSRVVWKRPLNGYNGTDEALSTEIPFLAMARALGDFWSLNPVNNEYIVSPEPDVSVMELHPSDSFIVIASDGLTNVMKPRQMAEKLRHLLHNKFQTTRCEFMTNNMKLPPNYAQFLIKEALDSWFFFPDNISVIAIELLFGGTLHDENTNVSPSNSASSLFVSSPSFSSLSDLDSISETDATDFSESIVEKNPFLDINETLTSHPSSMIYVDANNTYHCRTNAIRINYKKGVQTGATLGFKGPGFLSTQALSGKDNSHESSPQTNETDANNDENSADDSMVELSQSATAKLPTTGDQSTKLPTSDESNSPPKKSPKSSEKATPTSIAPSPSSLLSPFTVLATIRSSATIRSDTFSSTTYRRSFDKTPISHVASSDLTRPPAASLASAGDWAEKDAPETSEGKMKESGKLLKRDEQRTPIYRSRFATEAGDLNEADSISHDVYAFPGTLESAKFNGSASRKRPVRNQSDNSALSPEENSSKRIRLSEPKRFSLSNGISDALRAHQKLPIADQSPGTRTSFLNVANPMNIASAMFSREKMNKLRSPSTSTPNLPPKSASSQSPRRGIWGFVSSVFSKYMS